MIEGQEGVTWDQWRALATTAEAAGFEALFRSDHYMSLDDGAGQRLARRLGDHQRPGRPHQHHPARHARLTRHLPPPVGARPRGRHRRPRVRRARRARPRRRLARGRARGVRLPVRQPRASASTAWPSRWRSSTARGPRGRSTSAASYYRLQHADPLPRPVAGAAPAADRGRQRQAPRRRPRRPLGRRVQHRLRDAGGVPRAARARGGRLRGGGPRPDPLLADDELRHRRRPGRPPPGVDRRLDRRDGRAAQGARSGRRRARDAPAPAARRPRQRSS